MVLPRLSLVLWFLIKHFKMQNYPVDLHLVGGRGCLEVLSTGYSPIGNKTWRFSIYLYLIQKAHFFIRWNNPYKTQTSSSTISGDVPLLIYVTCTKQHLTMVMCHKKNALDVWFCFQSNGSWKLNYCLDTLFFKPWSHDVRAVLYVLYTLVWSADLLMFAN